jgi:type IV pilus assembly protein PilM
MATLGLGLDEGTSTTKLVLLQKRGELLAPAAAVSIPVSADGDTDAESVAAALSAAGIKGREVVAGLTGKDLVIRYHQVPDVPDWQLRKIMDFEIEEIKKQSGDELCADFNLLPVASDLSSDETVLLALSREQRVEERSARLRAARLRVRHFTPNAIALYHAFRVFGPAESGDVVLVNVGRTSSDLAILRDGDLLYARSVNTAGEVLDQALVQEFNVSAAKAETLKQEFGDLRPRDRRTDLSPQQEKVSYALETAAGRLFQMVQSTLQFARSQIQLNRLEPTKVYLTGGSARMRGLDEFLAAGLGVSVEVFDPVGEAGCEVEGPAPTPSLTVALGLAVLGADPEAYSVELLDSAASRTREFKERHLYTLLAFVLVLAYLGLSWVRTGGDYERAQKDSLSLSREQKRRKSGEARLQALSEEQAALAERLDLLEKKKTAGEALERTWSAVVRHLPPELWISRLELEYENDEVSRRAPRIPVVLVEGHGRSVADRSVDEAYREFVNAVRADLAFPDPGRFVDTPPTQRGDFDFRLRLDFLARPDEGAPGDGNGGADEEADS